jgi:hypothetical protein
MARIEKKKKKKKNILLQNLQNIINESWKIIQNEKIEEKELFKKIEDNFKIEKKEEKIPKSKESNINLNPFTSSKPKLQKNEENLIEENKVLNLLEVQKQNIEISIKKYVELKINIPMETIGMNNKLNDDILKSKKKIEDYTKIKKKLINNSTSAKIYRQKIKDGSLTPQKGKKGRRRCDFDVCKKIVDSLNELGKIQNSQSRRRNDYTFVSVKQKDIKEKVNELIFPKKISKSGLQLYLLPKNRKTINGKKHHLDVATVLKN